MASGICKLRQYISSQFIDNYTLEFEINSREELKQLEQEDQGRINWEKWDEIKQKTQDEIKRLKKKQHIPQRDFRYKTAAYTLDTNQLIQIFNSAADAAKYFNLKRTQVSYVINTYQGIYRKGNLYFKYIPNHDERKT